MTFVTRAEKRRRMEEQEKEKTKALKVAEDTRVVRIVQDLYGATIKAVEEFRHLPVRGPVEDVVSHVTKKPRKTMFVFELLIAMSIIQYLREIFDEKTCSTSFFFLKFMCIVARDLHANFQTCLKKFLLTPLDDRQEKLVTLRGKSRAMMSEFELLFAMTTLQHFTRTKIPVDGRAITYFSLDLPFLPCVSSAIFECCLRAIGCYEEKIDDEE